MNPLGAFGAVRRTRPLAAALLAAGTMLSGITILVVPGPAAAAEGGATYAALSPARVLDTRNGTGRGGTVGPIAAGGIVELTVAGVAGVPATGVDAVALNVTATNGTALNSFLTVFPAGTDRPLASNLNFTPGSTVPNMVVARVGANGRVNIYNNSGTADVIADVQGWYSTATNPVGSRYAPLEPARVLDTRAGIGSSPAPVSGGQTIDLILAGQGGLPASGVGAVVLNVTATEATGPDTFVTVFPSGTPRPEASNLNVVRDQTVPNLVIARVNNGRVSLYNNAGDVDLIADLQGWYPEPAGTPAGNSTYFPVAPVRALDTRDGTGTGGVAGPIGPGGLVVLHLAGRNGVPATGVTAVVLNVTVTSPTGPDSFLTVYPSVAVRPLASNLNFTANQTIANLVVSRVSEGGTVSIYNNLGSVHIVADVQGWFSTAT